MSTPASSETLIPGLPDDVSSLILALLPPSQASRARRTCRSWRLLLSPRSHLLLHRRLRLPPVHLLCLFSGDPSVALPLLLDPATSAWSPLPSLPPNLRAYGLSNFAAVSPRQHSPGSHHHLYVLGGSRFDGGGYPLDSPLPSAAAYSIDLSRPAVWRRIPNMLSSRGGFACATDSSGHILVAGGGSRHPLLPALGTRTTSAEKFESDNNRWVKLPNMPRQRAGCTGFVIRTPGLEEEEFWVMGGYGDYTVLGGVVPADVCCRDAFALGLSSGKWREIGDMWEDGERWQLGQIAVVDGGGEDEPGVFMLDADNIFRYNFALNRWMKVSSLPRNTPQKDSCCFAAVDGELFVLTAAPLSMDPIDQRRLTKKRNAVEFQIYDPKKKKWRFLTTSPPLQKPLDFRFAVLSTIQL